jgi:hypothetical protein
VNVQMYSEDVLNCGVDHEQVGICSGSSGFDMYCTFSLQRNMCSVYLCSSNYTSVC